jgi:hypothetical protein
MKTFWHWAEQQLPDGTLIWTLPDGHTYVTTPGSALLFPSLCAPTGHPPTPDAAPTERYGQRTAMMPLRTTTRAQNHATRIATERQHNREARAGREAGWAATQLTSHGHPPDGEPPPF